MIIRRLFAVGTVLLIVVGTYMAIVFKGNIRSFVITDDSISNFAIAIYHIDEIVNYSVDDLVNSSDTIIVAIPTGKRELRRDYIVTEVKIVKVLKTTYDLKQNSIIYVHEPVYINCVKNNEYLLLDGINNIMQTDNNYLLFLEFYQKPEGYKYNENEMRTFLFSKQFISVYSLDNSVKPLFIDDDYENSFLYKEIRDYDLVMEEKYYDTYMKLRCDVLHIFNIEH